MPVLATFLRKNHRALKLATLNALDVLITNYGMYAIVLERCIFVCVTERIEWDRIG